MARRPVLYLAIAAALLIAMKALVARIEPRLMFFPTSGQTVTPRDVGLEYRDLSIHTSDGETLSAWWIGHAAARADVVYFHGNGGNLSIWLPILAGVQASGLSVLACDYRGYGKSTGSPTEHGLYLDAEAVLGALSRLRREQGAPRDADERPIVYWGRSLGGAVAAYAASVARPDGLILESTFVDKAAVIRDHLALRALNVLSSYRFETARMLDGFDGPALVMHGDADGVVPFAAGRALFDRLRGPKRFVTLRGADHNDLFPATAREYWRAIEDLVRQAGHTRTSATRDDSPPDAGPQL
jgi:fermentation-respiration switch protein FrsA (DUF1100 family)